MLRTWLYVSRATIPPRSGEEGAIYIASRANNRRRGIGGHLHRAGDRFIQVVEGEERHIRALRRSIMRDWRHDRILTLLDGPIHERSFPEFDMGFSDGPDGAVPLLLRARPGAGVTLAAERVIGTLVRLAGDGRG